MAETYVDIPIKTASMKRVEAKEFQNALKPQEYDGSPPVPASDPFDLAIGQPQFEQPPIVPSVIAPTPTPTPSDVFATKKQRREYEQRSTLPGMNLPSLTEEGEVIPPRPIQADPGAPLGGISDISKMPAKTPAEAMEALGRGALFPIDLVTFPLDALSQTVVELAQLEKPTLFTEGFVASVEKFRDRPLKQQILIGLVTDPLIMFAAFKGISIAGRAALRGSAKTAAVNELRQEMARGAGRNAPSDVMDEAALFMIEQAQRGALRETEGSLVWEALEAVRIPQAAGAVSARIGTALKRQGDASDLAEAVKATPEAGPLLSTLPGDTTVRVTPPPNATPEEIQALRDRVRASTGIDPVIEGSPRPMGTSPAAAVSRFQPSPEEIARVQEIQIGPSTRVGAAREAGESVVGAAPPPVEIGERKVAGVGLAEFDRMHKVNIGHGASALWDAKNKGITITPPAARNAAKSIGIDLPENIDDAMAELERVWRLSPTERGDFWEMKFPHTRMEAPAPVAAAEVVEEVAGEVVEAASPMADDLVRATQRALPPGTGRTAEGAIISPGEVPSVARVAPTTPRTEPAMVIVTPQKPLGERLIFQSARAMEDAAAELGMRADEVAVLPGNATPQQVRVAAESIQQMPVSGVQTTAPVTRGGPRIVEPRPTQRQFQRGVDPEDLDAMRRKLRSLEHTIRTITPGPKPNSPNNQRIRAYQAQADALRKSIDEISLPDAPVELDIPGVIRREPITRITPSAQRALGPGQISPIDMPTVPPGVARREFSREGVPFEASTPEEAAQFRAQIREAPSPGQFSFTPVPEEVVTRSQAEAHIASEFYDAVPGSPMDIAATAYLRSGKIQDFIDNIPPKFEVSEGFADEVFNEVGRVSGKMADPTRTIQAIDFGFFGNAMQQGLLWPTRRTFIASLNWGDVTKVDYRKMLDRHGIRGLNPIRNRQKLDAAGDVLEEIGTNEVEVSIDILDAQMDHLLGKFSAEERIQIVNVARDTRVFFDTLLDAQNAARLKREQPEIAKLQNYRPWLRNTNLWSRMGFSDQPARELSQSPIPPDFIKPNEAFNPRALARLGGLEDFEKIRNIERLALDYVETARKDLFYTNIIQNGKAHIKGLQNKGLVNSAASIEDWIMESFAGKLPSASKFVRENVAPPIVKGMLGVRRMLTRSVFPLNWTWNTFIQTSSISLTVKNHGVSSTLQGLEYLVNPKIRDEVRGNIYSAIIKRRSGGRFVRQDIGTGVGQTDRLERSVLDTVEGWANFITNLMEDNLTGISVRAAHHDGVRRGLKGRALSEFASEGGSKTQSMYNLEDIPGTLRAKEVGAVVPFQTFAFEVFNTIRELGIPGLGKTGAFKTHNNRVVGLAYWFSAMLAFNMVGEKVNGRQPWQLSSAIPFWSIMLMGADPGNSWNYPLPLKYVADFKKGIENYVKHGDWTRLRTWAIRYHMLGGTQIERTLRGIEAVADGEVKDVSGRKLFNIDPDDWKKAISQGVYSTSEGKEYIDKLQESKGPIFEQTGISLPADISLPGRRSSPETGRPPQEYWAPRRSGKWSGRSWSKPDRQPEPQPLFRDIFGAR